MDENNALQPDLKPIRIGVNALYLIPGKVGGTEIYLRGLLRALSELDGRNEYFVFANRETGSDLVPKAPNFAHLPQPIRAEIRPARILWEQGALPLRAVSARLDVMLNAGFTAPLFCLCPQVTVFHDLQYKRYPEHLKQLELVAYRFLFYWSARVSRKVIADSEATARDLRWHYRLRDDKIGVVPLGVDEEFFGLGARRRPERVLLAVSTLHAHKNLDSLLRAFAAFRRGHPDFGLVVCGMHGSVTAQLHALRASLGLTDAVEFPGWIPRSDLLDLYARAWAFVYPSLFEGFGLPVVEAMAAGVPTACSAIEPLASIAGAAALQFDPRSPRDFARALARISDDEVLRSELAAAGPRRAALFSWKATAAATLRALVDTARPRGAPR
jgi:glycosyltransferase involved in cell wall biosynthesis